MNLADLVRYWGKTRPDHPAIIFGDTTQTWAEIDAVTDVLARGLATAGVRKGDRVGAMMRNRPELAHIILATLKLGAISVPLNFRLLGKELTPLLADADCGVVVVENDLAPLLEEAGENLTFRIFATESSGLPDYGLLSEGSGGAPSVRLDEDDPAFICYTSGTTGVQKGALLTHRSVIAPGQAHAITLGITGRDRALVAAPLVYTGSVISVFMQLVVYPGATMILEPDFDPDTCLAVMERHQVSIATSVPVLWERMAALPDFAGRKLADFVFAGAGGAPVGLDLLETFQSRGIPLTQAYGLTEASGHVATLGFRDAKSRPGFAGLPIVGTEIRIADPEGKTLPAGEIGEILVRGPHIMKGYWNRPKETAETIVDGWLHTGDLGLQDGGGFLEVVDRKKDMLISGGLNVYPAEIEKGLSGVDGIIDLAVIGVPDTTWGEVPMVLYHADKETSLVMRGIETAVRENLARYKWPKFAVEMTEPLPRTFSGKFAKVRLRQRFPVPPSGAMLIGKSPLKTPSTTADGRP